MKQFLLCTLCALILVGTNPAMAQQGENIKTPEERAKAMTDKMNLELGLSTEQYEKVHAVNLRFAKKNDEIRNGSAGRLAKLKSIRHSQNEKKKEMKTILTAEQYKKYEETLEERQSEVKEKYRTRNG